METKQYSVKVFEVTITNEEEFIIFFDKNYVFFQHHLICVNGEVNGNIESYLNNKGLKYITNVELPKGRKSSETTFETIPEEKKEIEPQAQKVIEKERNPLRVIDTLVRSGQELKIDGDLLLLNRINSGGSVNVNGNLIITQIVEGDVRCYGNFMMLKASPKANIVFHDVEVDNEYLKERLNRVELIDNEIKITPVLKETSWA